MPRFSKSFAVSWIEIFALIAGAYLIVEAATVYRVNNGTSPTISEHGVCRVVTNNSGKDVFIPTKTAAEWNSFINKPPAGVSLSTCSYTVEYFIMGGGGGGGGIGGNEGGGGGGGGGGYRTGSTVVTPGNNVSIVVGAGGAAGRDYGPWNPLTPGGNGGNSSAFGLTAYGGGGGGAGDCPDAPDYYTLCSPYAKGKDGGSGGGNGYQPNACAAASGAGYAGPPRQGYDGGWSCYGGGGGGGAAASAMGCSSGGGSGASGWGTGGDGVANNWINGTTYRYGTGGSTAGKWCDYGGVGGNNGPGGNGSWPGAGGGGAACDRGSPDQCPPGSSFYGGAGAPGIVIIRYPGAQRGTGGTVTSSGGYTVHYWNSPGSYTFSP